MNLALELLALLVYAPAVVLLHELGHAAFARRGGYRVTSFGIGLGKPLWRMELSRGAVLYVGRWLLAGGSCRAIPVALPSRSAAWFFGGGLLVQVVLMGVLVVLPQAWPLDRIAAFNALVLLTNALPWRLPQAASDGWHLLGLVRPRGAEEAVLPPRPVLERLARQEAQVKSPLGEAYASLCLAWLELKVGRLDEAAAHFRDDPPALASEPWLDALHHALWAEWCRQEHKPLAAVRCARQARQTLDDEAPELALALLDLAEARALVDLDADASARRVLGRLLGFGGVIGRQAAAVNLLATLHTSVDEIASAARRVLDCTDHPWLDSADAALACWRAADALDAHDRARLSLACREAARKVARQALSATDPADRWSLTRRLGPVAGSAHLSGQERQG